MSEELFPDIDADVVVAEVIMLRAESENAILIVEGGSDEKLLWDYVDHERCTMVIAEGKKNATHAINVILEEGLGGVVCLVDKDYDEYLGICHANDNTVITSLHDMEMMILHSRSFHRILREMGSKSKLKRITDVGNTPLRRILEAAYPLAVLRLISLRDQLNLKFEDLSFRSYDRKTLVADERKLCRDLITHSKSVVGLDDLCGRLENGKLLGHPHAMLCCGHDVTTLLGKALQSLFGSKNAMLVEVSEIESRLRLGYSWTDFIETSVYSDIRAWEARNHGYGVLIDAA